MNLAALTHGSAGLVLGWLWVCAGYGLGLWSAGAPPTRYGWTPLVAAPIGALALLPAALVAGLLHGAGAGAVGRAIGALLTLVAFAFFVGRRAASGAEREWLRRGAVITAPRPRALAPGWLTLAGLPVDPADEAKHFKMIGTTGTGKSTAIHELLGAALARGDRAVVADPDGGYAARHYDPNRGDLILNPFDPRSARWDPFRELRAPYDADQLARSLIGDGQGGEQAWRGYAQTLVAALLFQLAEAPGDRLASFLRLVTSADLDELRALLGETAAAALLEPGNERMFGSVRAVAVSRLAPLLYVREQRAPAISVRDWVEHGRGVLFLPYRADQIAALRLLVSTWMRTAIFQTMSQGESERRLWFIVDELDALGAIDGLSDALARLRKFGGRCVLGFQSIAQVSGTYGAAHAHTIVENCANTLLLRCSASEGGGTAQFAARLVGEREIEREQVSRSRAGGWWVRGAETVSRSRHRAVEPALLAAEIERLPDLEGYLKLASAPDWTRVMLRRPQAFAAADLQ